MRGARQLTVSRELRRRYPQAAQLELELAPDGAPGEPEALEVASWTAREWAELVRRDARGTWRVAALSLWRYARADWRRLLLRWECELFGRPYPLTGHADRHDDTRPPPDELSLFAA
jgi:hypothetical protein